MKSQLGTVAALACIIVTGPVHAEPADTPPESPAAARQQSPWRLGLALGYGERSNPLIQSSDIPVAVDVDIAWFGRRWFFDNGDLGLTISNTQAQTVSLVARVNSDRVFFGKTNTRFVQFSATGAPLANVTPLRVPVRSYAIEAGIEYLTDGRWGRVSLAAFQDISRTHDGFSIDAEYSFPWYGTRWSIEPGVTLRYKSAALNDYYWGVRLDESSAALPAFQARAGVNWQANLRAGYYLSPQLRLAASVTYERLNGESARSPLTRVPEVTGYFAGLAYQF